MKPQIVFVGLARNCRKFAPNFHKLREALNDIGVSSTAVIGENGSTDGTREAFTRPDIQIVDTSFMLAFSSRLERMARGRQKVAEVARQTFKPSAFCVIDLDNTMKDSPDPRSLKHALDRLQTGEAFAFAAQSKPFYYDLLAYEDDQRNFIGLDNEIAVIRKTGNLVSYYSLFRDKIYLAQRDLTRASTISCVSAFNGLCLYNSEAFATGSYVEDTDFNACEHVNFNRSIHRKTGRTMEIDPSLTVAMPPEHGPVGFFGFLARRTLKALCGAS